MAPTEIELRVRRLKWWQAICRDPANNSHFITIFFGRCKFENKAAEMNQKVAPTTLDDTERIRDEAHPHRTGLRRILERIAD